MFAKASLPKLNAFLKKGVVYRRHNATSLLPLFSSNRIERRSFSKNANDSETSSSFVRTSIEQSPIYKQWKQKHKLVDIDEMLHELHDEDQYCSEDHAPPDRKRFAGEILKISVVVLLGIYFGAVCAKLSAELLELYGIHIEDDDDDD